MQATSWKGFLFLDQILIGSESELPKRVQKLLSVMDYGIPFSAKSLMLSLGLNSRDGFRRNYLSPALAAGLICMAFPDKPNSRNQRYIRM